MDLTHIKALTAALERKDLEAMLTHLADDIVLKTPFFAESFKGKAAIRPVVAGLLSVVDKIEFREIMQGPEHVSSFFGAKVGEHELDGMDYWRLDASGRVSQMTVLLRPIPAAMAVQEKLVHAHG